MSLSGKIALVTGASRGIGHAIALRLAREGATVVAHYGRNAALAAEVVAEIERAGGNAFTLGADLAEREGPQRLIEALDAELRRRYGSTSFDILVNNAGVGGRAVLEEYSEALLDELMQINFKAPFQLMQLASPRLRTGGRIINITSTAARIAYPFFVVYGATKAALEQATVATAAHLGPRGITVNAVRPGAVETELNVGLKDPAFRENLNRITALGRVGQPRDIADAVAFIASEDARWITGAVLEASGGLRL